MREIDTTNFSYRVFWWMRYTTNWTLVCIPTQERGNEKTFLIVGLVDALHLSTLRSDMRSHAERGNENPRRMLENHNPHQSFKTTILFNQIIGRMNFLRALRRFFNHFLWQTLSHEFIRMELAY